VPVPILKPAPELERVDVGGYLDEWGDVRIKNLWFDRRCCLDMNKPLDVTRALELYRRWVQGDEYIVIKRTQELNGKTEREWWTVKAMKRGNDVYVYEVKKRLAQLERNLQKYVLDDGVHTKLLYITLTTNPKIYNGDINLAWQSIGKDWNRFLSSMKKEYGSVVIFRTWEAFRKGMPHIHALVGFKDHRFITIPHTRATREGGEVKTIRIPTVDKDRLARGWHSFVDVLAITRDNLKSALHDVIQYVTKFGRDGDYKNFDAWAAKRKLTLSCVWLFRLRTFAVSKSLLAKGMPDDDAVDLIMQTKATQTMTDVYGRVATVTYELLGMISGKKANISPDVWHKSYHEAPEWAREIWKPAAIRSGSGVHSWAASLN
jgi:hypothetical protein